MGKSGVPYFPLDVNLDTSFELIEAEFGIKGFGVIIKLFQLIYGEEGYYVEWTDEVRLLFAKRICMGGGLVSEIVEAAVKRGIFDDEKFRQYGILTSRGIQQRYVKAIGRRLNVEMKSEYLLLCNTQIPKNVNISAENVSIFNKNVNIFEQSKVKKSKVNNNVVVVNNTVTDKSGGTEQPIQPIQPIQTGKAEYLSAVHLLESIKGEPLNGYELRRCVDLVKEFGLDPVLSAFREMGDCNAYGIRYAEKILVEWRRHGRRKKGGGKAANREIMTNETDYSDIYKV